MINQIEPINQQQKAEMIFAEFVEMVNDWQKEASQIKVALIIIGY